MYKRPRESTLHITPACKKNAHLLLPGSLLRRVVRVVRAELMGDGEVASRQRTQGGQPLLPLTAITGTV